MKVKLLRNIQKFILEQPDQFTMDLWVRGEQKGASGQTLCKTAGCIAGWAVIVTDMKKGMKCEDAINKMENGASVSCEAHGRKALGLTKRQGERLFFTQNWPNGLGREYDEQMEHYSNRS